MAPTLLSLPVELRELIYQQLFGSYNINHGFHSSSSGQHRIALLQTCRQIYNEALRHLPLNCTLQFYGTENLLDTLMSADQSIVTRIRHICVKSFPFPLYGEGRPEYYPTYYLANALSLLPGLNLDTLVVYDSWHGGGGLADGWRDVVAYTDFESLMNADGWRELTYITPNTDFLTSGYDHRKLRVMQPDGWNSAIKERDGKESGAEVKMYIVLDRQQDAEGDLRTEHGKIMQPWSAQPGHEVIENWRIATPQQDWKGQVRIISKRGKRVSVAQKGMREKKTWKELKGEAGTFRPTDWKPYYHDMADAMGWMYGGWGRRMQMASRALNC